MALGAPRLEGIVFANFQSLALYDVVVSRDVVGADSAVPELATLVAAAGRTPSAAAVLEVTVAELDPVVAAEDDVFELDDVVGHRQGEGGEVLGLRHQDTTCQRSSNPLHQRDLVNASLL